MGMTNLRTARAWHHAFTVIARQNPAIQWPGDPVTAGLSMRQRFSHIDSARAYWIARSSRAMTPVAECRARQKQPPRRDAAFIGLNKSPRQGNRFRR
jgi:hypothetical protein